MHLAAFVDDVHAVSHDLTVYASDRPEAVERLLSGVIPPASLTVTEAGPQEYRPGTLLDVSAGGLALATPSVEAVPESLLTIDGHLSVTGTRTTEATGAASELATVDETTFTLSGASQDLIDRAARQVTALALDTGGGVTHVGLGSLSRLRTDDRTRRECERVAAGGTAHVYGSPATDGGIDLPGPVHRRESGELTTTRFVAHDGDGDPRRAMALVAVATEQGAYRGFLTFRPGLVEDLCNYLSRTYSGGSARGRDALKPS